MRLLLFLIYLAVEIAAFWAMAHYLGVGWAILITVAASAVGVALLGRRGRAVFADLGRASRSEISTAQPLTDTALLAASTVLTIIPGVVTTLLGVTLMFRPIRRLMAPVVGIAVARRAPGLFGSGGLIRTRVVVDGTVVDGSVIDSTPRARTDSGTGYVVEGDVVEGEIVEGDVVDDGDPQRRLPPGPGRSVA